MSAAKAKCPICGDKTKIKTAPFCSERCKDVDLNRWLDGSYAIPTSERINVTDPSNDNQSSE